MPRKGAKTYRLGVHILAAPDKFKGTATAAQIARTIARAATALGHECTEIPLADGGEGTLAALAGANRESVVTGPLGSPVQASWRLDQTRAVIEMAEAAGLVLAGGPQGNDPLAATTRGVGELIIEAVEAGARSIVVAVGGSATTDGGLGALAAIGSPSRLAGVDIVVACDVRTTFTDAARVFAPQKGASPTQVELLTRRLDVLADSFVEEYGIDVRDLPHSGAAGGLAGGLAAIGAKLTDGFDVVAEAVRLDAAIEAADLVVTGEGFVDAESFEGKVVGGVTALAAELGVPSVVVAGQVFDEVDERVHALSLADLYGLERALDDPVGLTAKAVTMMLERAAGER